MYRDIDNKVIGGVCAGIAEQYGWNPTVVRVAAVASMMLPGPQIILYLLLWALIPAK